MMAGSIRILEECRMETEQWGHNAPGLSGPARVNMSQQHQQWHHVARKTGLEILTHLRSYNFGTLTESLHCLALGACHQHPQQAQLSSCLPPSADRAGTFLAWLILLKKAK